MASALTFANSAWPAQICVGCSANRGELAESETYFLMPFPDCTLRPMRMTALRRLTLSEYRLSHLTALRLREQLAHAGPVIEEVHLQILGPELLDEINR